MYLAEEYVLQVLVMPLSSNVEVIVTIFESHTEVVSKKIDLLSHLCFIKLFPLENVSIKHPPLKIWRSI